MIYKRNLNEMEWSEMGHGERFMHHRKTLTPFDQPYLPKVGISLYRLAPGKRAFPRHEHMANDEAILVTSGSGTLRCGDSEVALAAGDYVHLPAASGNAHQVVNTSDADLEYYCLSSMIGPEVVRYPDSSKLGAFAMTSTAEGAKRFGVFVREEPLDYWDGESS